MSRESPVIIGSLCDWQTEETWAQRLDQGSSRAIGRCACCPGKRRVSRTLVVVFVFIFIFILPSGNFAQDAPPTEYQIKAAFLYHFAQFVQWPPQVFANTNSPLVIGVLGENVFGDDLQRTIRDKTVNEHPFQFEEFRSLQEATNCQILFISPSEKKHLPKILTELAGMNILTVSEMDHFTESGGMINFIIQNDEIHFQINNDAAKKAGLQISSKLLTLAVH